ncbi:MAG: SIR2 family protein, partial [Promethearchaeota archaeon]
MQNLETKSINNHLNFLETPESLVFLIGAGCSSIEPSNAPIGRKIIETLIKFFLNKSEVKKILSIENIKLEKTLSVLQEVFDENLKIIEYFNEFTNPNLVHFFIARMLKEGSLVMTTNFDPLIELALLRDGVPKKKIIPLITKRDFDKVKNVENYIKTKRYLIGKIHGSPKNFITGANTKKELVKTIKVLGNAEKNKGLFQLEPFKARFLDSATKERSLIVMGYSGRNDDDIIPTIKALSGLKEIFWINHVEEKKEIEEVIEIRKKNLSQANKLDDIDNILLEIKEFNEKLKIFRVNINILELIKKHVDKEIEIKPDENFIDYETWLTENFNDKIDEKEQLQAAGMIYSKFGQHYDAIRCFDELFNVASEEKDSKWQVIAALNKGLIYAKASDFDNTREWLRRSLE